MSCQSASPTPGETWVAACTGAPAPLALCQDVQSAAAEPTACPSITDSRTCSELMRVTDDSGNGPCTWCFTGAPTLAPSPFVPNPDDPDGKCLPQPHGWYDVGGCDKYNVECGWRTRQPTTAAPLTPLPLPVPSTGAGSCPDCLRQNTGPNHWDTETQTCGTCAPGQTCVAPCTGTARPKTGACPDGSAIATCPPVTDLNVKGDYSFQCRYGDDTFVDYAGKNWPGAAKGDRDDIHWPNCAAVLLSATTANNKVSITFPCRPGQSTEEVTVEQITDCNGRTGSEDCEAGQCDWTASGGSYVCLPKSLQNAQCKYVAGLSESSTTHDGMEQALRKHDGMEQDVITLDLRMQKDDDTDKVATKEIEVWGAYRCVDGMGPAPDDPSSCASCPAGHYGIKGQCYACDVGTAYAQTGLAQNRCPACKAGTYARQTGQSTCAPCGINEYQPEEGQSTCLPVPAGHVATATTPSPLQDTVCSRWNDAKRDWPSNSSTYVKNLNFLGQGNAPFNLDNECTKQNTQTPPTCTSGPSSVCSGDMTFTPQPGSHCLKYWPGGETDGSDESETHVADTSLDECKTKCEANDKCGAFQHTSTENKCYLGTSLNDSPACPGRDSYSKVTHCHFQLGRPSVSSAVNDAFTTEQEHRAAGPEAGTVLGLCNAEPYRILPDGSSGYDRVYWVGTAKPAEVVSIGTRWVHYQSSSDYVSRDQASVACQAQGKRLCTQAEVTSAAQRGGADGGPRPPVEQCLPGYTSDARGLFMTEALKGCWDQAGWFDPDIATSGAWCCPAYDLEMTCMESEGQCTSKPLANYDFKIVPRSATGGATATALCPEGTYAVVHRNNGPHGNQCAPCPVGHKCTGGISTACSAGTYQDKTRQTTCQPCAAGTYQDQEGQEACKKCGGPQYYCTAEASTRTEVDAGYYSTGGDPTTRTGQAKCGGAYYYCTGGEKKTVDHGYHTIGGDRETRTGQAECGGPEYFCFSGEQMTVDTGHYSTPADGPPDLRTGQLPCADNQYCTNGVATTCKAGTEPGNQTCNECNPGSYSPDGSPCQECWNEWIYQPSFGQAACKSCPPGSKANQARTACCPSACSGAYMKDGEDCRAYGWLCNSDGGETVCKKACGCPATGSGGTCSKDDIVVTLTEGMADLKKGMSCSYISFYTGDSDPWGDHYCLKGGCPDRLNNECVDCTGCD